MGILYLDNEDGVAPVHRAAPGRGLDVRAPRGHRHPAGPARGGAADEPADGRAPERAAAPQHRDRGEADAARARGRHARRHRDGRLGPDRQAVRDPRRWLPAASRSAARPAAASPRRACSTRSSGACRPSSRRWPRSSPTGPWSSTPIPGDGLLHRFLVARVVLHGKTWGYLAVMEYGSRFTALDLATSRHAATAIAIELSVERPRDRRRPPGSRGPGPGPRQRPRGPRGARAPRGAAELPDGEPAPRLPARRAGRRPPR